MYTDDELHKMCDAAMKRGDQILAAAIVSVAVAHENGLDDALLAHLLMWNNFYTAHREQSKQEGGMENGHDLTAISPDRVIQL